MNTLRKFASAALIALLVGGVGMAWAQDEASQSGAAQNNAAQDDAAREGSVGSDAAASGSAQNRAAADLPVSQVVLFTSGVGYFEHAGTVTGDATLELAVGTEHMDDILQSLVLQDLDGGTIRPVRYPSQDPLGRILGGYELDLSGNPTLADLLSQARGERVRVDAGTPLEGTIVNVEHVMRAEEPETWLTLNTDDGLVRVSLAEVRRIQFVDDVLQAELEAALATLADARGDETRIVTLAFEGDGERRVRVGYVREMPVWKTSYRLVLGDDGRADLQGWAIVDNPTDMDLRAVQLSFVAGQPISFVTNLYSPVYVDRPRVDVTTAPSVVPPQYEEEFADSANRSAAPSAAEAAGPMADMLQLAPMAPQLGGAGVQAMAQGTRTGATFVYRVEEPVTVERHESAMVPIVQQSVPAQRLSIFDESVLSERPLRGVRVLNDTGLHLAAGTISVFDAGGFTGNARIADVLPGESRILTYAVDLETTVATERTGEPERVTAVQLQDGVLVTEVRDRIRTTYRVDADAANGRFLVVEHPKTSGYDVVAPEPAPAETANAWRFGVLVPGTVPGTGEPAAGDDGAFDEPIPTHLVCEGTGPCALEVVLERVASRQLAIGNVTPDQIVFYLENVELSSGDRATLQQILELKRQLVELDRRIAEVQTQLAEIAQEQSRIRQNMGELDRDSSLYRRYVSDLEAQEDAIDALQSELEALRSERASVQSELDDLILSLQPE